MTDFSDGSNIDWANDLYDEESRRFYVWRNGTDFFNYTQLAHNWDILDGIIGRPDDNSQWPPSIGVGGGIWAEIQRLEDLITGAYGVPLGMLSYWFRPSDAVPLSYITNRGWEICDGHQVTDHDYPGFVGSFYTPDLRNMFIVGADITKSQGTAGTTTAAPGMVLTTAGDKTGGASGQHTAPHTHTTPAHSHTIGNHTHTINGIHVHNVKPHTHPIDGAHTHTIGDHQHGMAPHAHQVMDHYHTLGGTTGQPTYLPGGEQTKDGTGTLHTSAFQYHTHHLPAGTGGIGGGGTQTVAGGTPVTDPAGATTTSSAGPTGTGAAGATTDAAGPTVTGSAGATTTSSHPAGNTGSSSPDNRPRNVGLLPIIKVRY